MQHTAPPLDEYVDIDELHPKVQPTFSTKDSIDWFVRRNRIYLVAAGAMIIIAGRRRFHPERFKQAAVEIGKTGAQRQERV